jgi:hypothetical protein
LMAGRVSQCTDKFEKALQEAEVGIALDPSVDSPYSGLVEMNIVMGRLPQAEAALKRASDRNLKNVAFLFHRYEIAFLKDDTEEMRRQVGLAQARQGAKVRWLTCRR